MVVKETHAHAYRRIFAGFLDSATKVMAYII